MTNAGKMEDILTARDVSVVIGVRGSEKMIITIKIVVNGKGII